MVGRYKNWMVLVLLDNGEFITFGEFDRIEKLTGLKIKKARVLGDSCPDKVVEFLVARCPDVKKYLK